MTEITGIGTNVQYVFEVVNHLNEVVIQLSGCYDTVPYEAFLPWVRAQEEAFASEHREGTVWKASLLAGNEGSFSYILLREVKMFQPRDISFREYKLIERVTADEFIDADIDHESILSSEVRVIYGGKEDCWVFAFNPAARYLYSIRCEHLSSLLQLLSLGGGHCTPTFLPDFDFNLDDDFTSLENEVWLEYLTAV